MILFDMQRGRTIAYTLKKLARKKGEEMSVKNWLIRLKAGLLTEEEAKVINERHEHYFGRKAR